MTGDRKPTPEERAAILAALPWLAHGGCKWEQVGPCVYCADHNERLYSGRLPPRVNCPGHEWDEQPGDGFWACRHCGLTSSTPS